MILKLQAHERQGRKMSKKVWIKKHKNKEDCYGYFEK